MRFFSLSALALLAGGTLAHAASFAFDGSTYDVQYITGSGASKAMLVLDFNSTIYQFGYQWDGTPKTSAQMLDDVAAAGGVDVTSSFTGTPAEYVTGITFAGSGQLYAGPNLYGDYPGNWYQYYTSPNPVAWSDPGIGAGQNLISDGEWDIWTRETTAYPGENLPGPIPEPATLGLLGVGGMGLLLKRRVK